MRILSRNSLRQFWEMHPKAEQQLKAWFAEVEAAEWNSPNDVKAKYGSASILQDGRVVFNICGNHYRLIVHIRFEFKVVYIRFIGTHNEYDQIDAKTI